MTYDRIIHGPTVLKDEGGFPNVSKEQEVRFKCVVISAMLNLFAETSSTQNLQS